MKIHSFILPPSLYAVSFHPIFSSALILRNKWKIFWTSIDINFRTDVVYNYIFTEYFYWSWNISIYDSWKENNPKYKFLLTSARDRPPACWIPSLQAKPPPSERFRHLRKRSKSQREWGGCLGDSHSQNTSRPLIWVATLRAQSSDAFSGCMRKIRPLSSRRWTQMIPQEVMTVLCDECLVLWGYTAKNTANKTLKLLWFS